MTDPKEESETSSVLNRHYSTIGIHNVFLEPPPTKLLPTSYLNNNKQVDAPFLTFEIVGAIKSVPQDFVVREILSRKRSPKIPDGFNVVADLALPSEADTNMKQKETTPPADSQKRVQSSSNEVNKKESETPVAQKQCDEPSPSADDESSPADVCESILVKAFDKKKATDLLNQIQMLQQRALDSLRNRVPTVEKDVVWIPPLGDDDSPSRSNRGRLHRNLRHVYSLVKTETAMYSSKTEPPCKESEGTSVTNGTAAAQQHHTWIQVSIDKSFFGLAPSLYQPQDDIPLLSAFRNKGITNSAGKQNGDRKRKRDAAPIESVILRLRPDLERDERRPLHHLISKTCRDFETSTISNYCTTDEGDSVAAIVVKWSRRAQQRAKKKVNGSNKTNVVNTLCVLKKTKKEHLSAVKQLTYGIRCRQEDIGLAGIKDMHAVTYQFCTIANVTAKRVERAKSLLSSQGIELGRIQEVDWVLQQGDLQGNRFEIVIRNLKRIQVQEEGGVRCEEQVPCEREHICDMLERIRKSGFVNFYGEQRLGVPGRTSEVGVRPFDIGRALLQRDFSDAINLLMTGRLVCRGQNELESPEVRRARQIWKESSRDVEKTLNAIPKGGAMSRERTVLQGFKRYGVEDPLSALKCLHSSVRTFWINAYQSFVWNAMASERLKRFGTQVVKGDLYRLPDGEGNADVRVVTDDPSSIDIADVVLPLPGFAVQYPANEIGDLYREFLQKEKVSFDREAPSEATAKGAYRPLIAFAQNLEVSFDSTYGADGSDAAAPSETVSDVLLKFDLPSGSYATMLLREMMLTTVVR